MLINNLIYRILHGGELGSTGVERQYQDAPDVSWVNANKLIFANDNTFASVEETFGLAA